MSKRLLVGSGVVLVIGLGWGMIILRDRLGLRLNADKDERDRLAAIKALGKTGPGAVPKLIADLQHEDARDRRAAVYALFELGSDGKGAIPALCAARRDEDKDVRHWSAAILGNLGPEAAAAVPALGEALMDKNNLVRQSAADALIEIGPAAQAALPALADALADEDREVRRSVIHLLCQWDGLGGHVLGALAARALHARNFNANLRLPASSPSAPEVDHGITPTLLAGLLVRLTLWAVESRWLAHKHGRAEFADTLG
jgi:HEAT repeat protein